MNTEADRETTRWEPGIVNLVESLLESPPEAGIYYSVERGKLISPRCDPSISKATTLWVPRILEAGLSQHLTAIGWKFAPISRRQYREMSSGQRREWQERVISEK